MEMIYLAIFIWVTKFCKHYFIIILSGRIKHAWHYNSIFIWFDLVLSRFNNVKVIWRFSSFTGR